MINMNDLFFVICTIIFLYIMITIFLVIGILETIKDNFYVGLTLCIFIVIMIHIYLPLQIMFILCDFRGKWRNHLIRRKNRVFNKEIYQILLENVEEKYLINIIEEYSDINLK